MCAEPGIFYHLAYFLERLSCVHLRDEIQSVLLICVFPIIPKPCIDSVSLGRTVMKFRVG